MRLQGKFDVSVVVVLVFDRSKQRSNKNRNEHVMNLDTSRGGDRVLV